MSSTRPDRRPIYVLLVSLLAAAGFVVGQLAQNDWNPTILTAFGEADLEIREFAEDRLGNLALRPELGHDGRFFFVQANDPWIVDPVTNASVLDRPTYRSQRMLYPILASVGGTLGPSEVVWGLIVINVLAIGVGSWATAILSIRIGGSPWWGLAFFLNLGLISELALSGAGVVATALAFGAVVFVLDRRWLMAAVLLALAVLAREVMMVTAVGLGFWVWRTESKREALPLVVIPATAILIWALYVRLRIGNDNDLTAGNIGVPLAGLLRSVDFWLSDPIELAISLVTLLMLGFFFARGIREPSALSWAFIGFVPLAAMLTEPVWHGYFNITRAVAPVLTAYILLAFAGNGGTQIRNLGGGLHRTRSGFG